VLFRYDHSRPFIHQQSIQVLETAQATMTSKVFVLISLMLLAAPALSIEDDDMQSVVSRLDNKLQNLEGFNEAANNDGDETLAHDETRLEEDDSSKVSSDVSELEETIQSSNIPSHVRAAAIDNLSAIKKDAKEYTSAPRARRESLAKALSKRVEALRMQLTGDNTDAPAADGSSQSARSLVERDIAQVRSTLSSANLPSATRTKASRILEEMSEKVGQGSSSELLREVRGLRSLLTGSQVKSSSFEEDVPSKVTRDVSELEASLDSSNLPAQTVGMAKTNLAAIRKNVELIASGVGASRKADLSKAIGLRMSALKLMLKSSSSSTHQFEEAHESTKEARVLKDIQEIENSLSHAKIPSTRRQEAINNLEAIKKDTQALASASTHRASALKEALNLRLKALHQELN